MLRQSARVASFPFPKFALIVEGYIFITGARYKAGLSCPTVLCHTDLSQTLILWVKRRLLDWVLSYSECCGVFSRTIPAGLRHLINNNHDSAPTPSPCVGDALHPVSC